MTMLEAIKSVIDKRIDELSTDKERFVCPPAQMKTYYLKCCHLLWTQQVAHRAIPDEQVFIDNIATLKMWMQILREAKV